MNSLLELDVFITPKQVEKAVAIDIAYEYAQEYKNLKIAVINDYQSYNNETYSIRSTSEASSSIKQFGCNHINTTRTFDLVVCSSSHLNCKEVRKLILASIVEKENSFNIIEKENSFKLIVTVNNYKEFLDLVQRPFIKLFEVQSHPYTTYEV